MHLTVRGQHLDRFLPLVLAELGRSLDRYPGLTAQRRIKCPLPDSPEHPPHAYKHQQLLKRLLRDGTTITCPETDDEIDITPLLAGITPDPNELSDLATTTPFHRLEAKLSAHFDRLEGLTLDRLESLKRDTAKLVTVETEAVGVRCPSVFTVRAVRSGPVHTHYQLRMCCEQSDGWHEVTGKEAVYDLRTLHAWAQKVTPTVQTIAATAKAVTPLISLLLAGIALDLHGTAKKDVLDARKHLPPIPGRLAVLDDKPGATTLYEVTEPTAFAQTDADYRQLSALLQALDASRVNQPRWGGLSAALDNDGHAIYLCPDHAPRR
jgi:hypothetical protein